MSAGAERAAAADPIELGVVAGAFGVRGWLRIRPHTADPQALLANREWLVAPPEAAPRALGVVELRAHGDGLVARLSEVDDRDAAEALKGARIFLARSDLPAAGPDEYYWVDLIGLEVVNLQGEPLGSVAGLIDNGAQSVLRVAAAGGDGHEAERLIPFVPAYVVRVDLAARRIVVDWGLDY